MTFQKTIDKLEVTIQEYSLKIEELNRTVVDLQTYKGRMSQVTKNFSNHKTVHEILLVNHISFISVIL